MRVSDGPMASVRGRAVLGVAGAMVLLANGAFAGARSEPPADAPVQTAPPPESPVSSDPELTDPSVDRQLDAMRKRLAPTNAVAPKGSAREPSAPPGAGQAADPVPGMAAADFGVPGARRMREGAFISRRPGVLVHIPSGEWVFVPRPIVESSNDGTDGPPRAASLDRPLIVLPSQTLERLEAAMATVEEGRGRTSAVLSGQIFSYREREYLLPQQPSSLSAASVEPTSAPPGAPPPSGQPERAALPTEESEEASVKELIRDLELRRTAPKALSRTGTAVASIGGGVDAAKGPGGVGSSSGVRGNDTPANGTSPRLDERSKSLVPEGTILTSRRGRVVRLAGGELAFAVENDGQNATEPAMTLLPSATLQRLEDLILWRGDRQAVEVSGRTTSYGGKNYLMPTMFVVPPASELAPMQ